MMLTFDNFILWAGLGGDMDVAATRVPKGLGYQTQPRS